MEYGMLPGYNKQRLSFFAIIVFLAPSTMAADAIEEKIDTTTQSKKCDPKEGPGRNYGSGCVSGIDKKDIFYFGAERAPAKPEPKKPNVGSDNNIQTKKVSQDFINDTHKEFTTPPVVSEKTRKRLGDLTPTQQERYRKNIQQFIKEHPNRVPNDGEINGIINATERP